MDNRNVATVDESLSQKLVRLFLSEPSVKKIQMDDVYPVSHWPICHLKESEHKDTNK